MSIVRQKPYRYPFSAEIPEIQTRALYPDSSLADLYDELTMPPELRKAHQSNDRAVMQAYGFSVKDMTESSCVAELMKMYQTMTVGTSCGAPKPYSALL